MFITTRTRRGRADGRARVRVVMNMLTENGNDFTFAGAPKTTFSDGVDPDFARYFDFDLADTTTAPNTYMPKP